MMKFKRSRSGSRRGNSFATREYWDITYSQLEILVALLAAENIGCEGATMAELATIDVGQGEGTHIGELERKRWVVCVGFTGKNRQQKVWAPHPRTRRELFPSSREATDVKQDEQRESA